MATGGKFIQKMHLKKGALHKALGVPMGQDIPHDMLVKAAARTDHVGRMAKTALTLEDLNN